MNRKEFLSKTAKLGSCCGVIMFFQSLTAPLDGPVQGAESGTDECQRRRRFAVQWIQWMMASVDEVLDPEAAGRLMEANGYACHVNAYPPRKKENPAYPTPDEWVAGAQRYVGKENCRREENRIYFNYFRNPKGLRVEDGYCLCPLLEDEPKQISPSYCRCSVGYVREMMHQALGKEVHVELKESLRSGGKGCKFVITL